MPYIKKEDRDLVSPVTCHTADSCGELNYQITMLCRAYLHCHGLSYQTCNDIVGALDNAKDEFRRRIQHPYEDQKIKENGDVY